MSGFGWRPRAVVACLLGGAALYGGLSTSAAGAKPVKPPVYSLATRSAVSSASVPLFVKKLRFRFPGVTSATRAARSAAALVM